MMPKYKKRQFGAGQGAINMKKLELARELKGKEVVIAGVARKVVGYNERTGEIEVRIGLRTQLYDPTSAEVVERQKA